MFRLLHIPFMYIELERSRYNKFTITIPIAENHAAILPTYYKSLAKNISLL